ncbi:MAG: hypothetical protein WEC75_08640 [Dehalococcoidia bacterium]
MPRGGRRPGAGAPKGNLNALKSGRYSPRVRAVLYALVDDPTTRSVLLQVGLRGAAPRGRLRDTITDTIRLLHDRPVSDEFRARVRALLGRDDDARIARRVQSAMDSYRKGTGQSALAEGPLRRGTTPAVKPPRPPRVRYRPVLPPGPHLLGGPGGAAGSLHHPARSVR